MDTMASALAVGDRSRTHREQGESDWTAIGWNRIVSFRVNRADSVVFSDFAETQFVQGNATALPGPGEHATIGATR